MRSGYGQYCPIARGAEIFAERWTPLIIRNLFLGCRTFTEIREGAPGISKTLLTQRLRQLESRGIVERRQEPGARASTYRLTESGAGLVDVCFALGDWGARWLEVAPEHFDAHVTLWSMARLMHKGPLPKDRLVVRFDLTDVATKNRFWMVVEAANSEVCLKNPGYQEDVFVTTTSEWLAKWHMGWITMQQAERQGLLSAMGPRHLVRALDTGSKSPFAKIKPARADPVIAAMAGG
jgi:DNA-binding HxlR family transcriptional regulator